VDGGSLEGVANKARAEMPEGGAQGLNPRCLPEGVAQNCILLYRRFVIC
jgi:hypothetical protein